MEDMESMQMEHAWIYSSGKTGGNAWNLGVVFCRFHMFSVWNWQCWINMFVPVKILWSYHDIKVCKRHLADIILTSAGCSPCGLCECCPQIGHNNSAETAILIDLPALMLQYKCKKQQLSHSGLAKFRTQTLRSQNLKVQPDSVSKPRLNVTSYMLLLLTTFFSNE